MLPPRYRTACSRALIFVTLFLFLFPAALRAQFAPTGDSKPAPDTDRRAATTASRSAIAPPAPAEALRVLGDLRQAVPDLQVRWSVFTGAPSRLFSQDGALTPPRAGAPREIALGFVQGVRGLFGLAPEDLDDLPVTRDFATAHNGVTHLTFQQRAGGIEVFGGEILVNVLADGRILSLSGEPIAGIQDARNASSPALEPEAALGIATGSVGLTLERTPERVGAPSGRERETVFAGGTAFARDVTARLVWFPVTPSDLRLAWDVTFWEQRTPNGYRAIVDATSGEVLYRRSLTYWNHVPAHGQIYTSDSPNPDTPIGTSTGIVARVDTPFNGLASFSHDDPHADWWNGSGQPDRLSTKSNNAFAKQDRDGDNDDSEGFVTAAAGENYNFTLNLASDPSTYTNASVVNAFYWVNRVHDLFYRLGFDEASGNFQVDNFGLGGSGGDPVQVDAQDNRDGTPPSMCNANMGTPGDGSSPRMQMYQCDRATPERDGDLEAIVIAHEYGHGVHARLVPSLTDNQGGMSEGWGDFFGLTFTAQPGDNFTTGQYGVGGWLFNNNGIRRERYSADKTVFTRTYAKIKDGAACEKLTCSNNPTQICTKDADCGAGNTCDPRACQFDYQCQTPPAPVNQGLCYAEVHNTGELWCETLWLAWVNAVQKYGFTTGGETVNRLVIDGMKLAPSQPDFLDMRDAILQADVAGNGGVNRCLLWDAFARMGMGFTALSYGPHDLNPIESYDMPSACTPNIVASGARDFGKVCPQEYRDQVFSIQNTGQGDLIVRAIGFTAATAHFTLQSPPTPWVFIAPGAHADITVRFAPTSSGPKTATLRITTNDPDSPNLDLALTGEGSVPAIEAGPDPAFGSVCGPSADLSLPIFNNGDCDLRVTGVTLGAGCGDFSLVPGPTFPTTIQPAGQIEVGIRYTPSGAGPDSCTVQIASNDPARPTLTRTATGDRGSPNIEVNEALDFGIACDSVSGTLQVFNTGSCDLTVSSVAFLAGCTDFAVTSGPATPVTVQPGSEVDFTITYTPSGPGPVSCTLRIQSNDPDTPTKNITVTGEGGSGNVAVSGSLNFGGIPVDDQTEPHLAVRTLRIYNEGTCPLAVSSVSRTAGSPDILVLLPPSFPVSLPAGAHIDVDIEFNPSTAGAHSATITVATDDPDTPSIALTALGKGLVPAIASPAKTAGGLLFDPTVVGCGSEETVTIQNLGQAELIISAIAATNPDYTVVGATPPLRLPAGASLDLTVLFSPTAVARSIRGDLEITCNDPTNPVFTVPLCGEGVETGMRLLVVDPTGAPVPRIDRIQLDSHGIGDKTLDKRTAVPPTSVAPPDSCSPFDFHYERALTPTETSGLQGSHYTLRVTVKDKGQPETRRVSFTLGACEYKQLLLRVD